MCEDMRQAFHLEYQLNSPKIVGLEVDANSLHPQSGHDLNKDEFQPSQTEQKVAFH